MNETVKVREITRAVRNIVKSYRKFNPASDFTDKQARELADGINSGTLSIPLTNGNQCYCFMGWIFDIGRKPYLVEYNHGCITRYYGRSVADIRNGLKLSPKDRVVADPFQKGGS